MKEAYVPYTAAYGSSNYLNTALWHDNSFGHNFGISLFSLNEKYVFDGKWIDLPTNTFGSVSNLQFEPASG